MKKIIKYVASFFFIFLFFPVTSIAGEIVKVDCTNNNGPFTLFFDSDGGKQQIFSITWNVAFTKDAIFGAIENGSGFFINFVTGEFYNNSHKIADCKFSSNLEALKKKNTEDIVADAIEGKIIQLDEMRVQLDEMRLQRDEMKAELNNYLLQQSSTLKNKEGSGMPIDCSWKNTVGLMVDYYFSYVNSDYEFKPDGKYQITIYSNYINGNFRINEMVSIPYIKSKSTFAPEYDGHWSTRDLRESELEILQKKDGFSDCKIKTIVYKGE
jgi:hypothetical protein